MTLFITIFIIVLCLLLLNGELRVHDFLSVHKKGLKISKGQSESVQRRTDKHNGQKKVQKDKQRSTKYTHKTKDRVARTPLKTRGELMCSGRVSSSCSTNSCLESICKGDTLLFLLVIVLCKKGNAQARFIFKIELTISK